MQQYSRRQIIKLVGLASGCLLLPPLAGCSSSGESFDISGDTAPTAAQFNWLNATGTYSPSDAFGRKGVWFSFGNDAAKGSETVAKDTWVTLIHEFHGDGTVTSWYIDHNNGASKVQFKDLEGLSDEEVLSLAKDHWPLTRDDFEDKKRNALENLTASYEKLKNEARSYPDINVENDYFSRFFERLQSLSMQDSPDAKPYFLKVQTDDSGNNTEHEQILLERYDYPAVFDQNGGMATKVLWNELIKVDDDVKFESVCDTWLGCCSEQYVSLIENDDSFDVYESTYQGFGGIVTRTGGSASFALDFPTAQGIEVD